MKGQEIRKWVLTLAVVALAAGLFTPRAAAYDFRFDDVPADHTFAEDIGWLRMWGVTYGCNPPANTRFCPDDEVSRGQMAAFMHRLTENVVFGPLAESYTDRGVWVAWDDFGSNAPFAISFPRRLLWPPTVKVVRAGTTVPACPGTVGSPEADPGTLCVYEVEGLDVSDYYVVDVTEWGVVINTVFEFYAVDQGVNNLAWGTWALGGIQAG